MMALYNYLLCYGTFPLLLLLCLFFSGLSGDSTKQWVKSLLKDFNFPHLRILFPTAPLRPYTLLDGELSNVWFNRLGVSLDTPEHMESLNEAGRDVVDFINTYVIKTGIPENRIIVGGFSMGGSLALHTGFRFMPQLAGVFALSTFLCHTSSIYGLPKRADGYPPLFMCHGDRDDIVPHEWGKGAFENLTSKLGVEGTFHTIPNAQHVLRRKELIMLKEWLNERLPPRGFSMGGALAMHTGLRLMPQLAGIFALSSFLSYTSSIYELPKRSDGYPPLFMCHGDRDDLVSHEWGEGTFKTLTSKLGVQGTFHTIPNALHELKKKEILMLKEWLNERLPPS
ncbi:hypothetical protein C0J52_17198 [Blattella germanica]|nr:hypothetical protein C0J52_17198 [Blattella germanica]